MSTEIAVLRALLHFSRRRAPATLEDLQYRVGGDVAEIQRALGSLARAQLVLRPATGEHARLSFAGLAVAVAAAANARRAKTVARPAKPARVVVSLVRRRRAA